ncbi:MULTISPECIES: hypothetical protein [unclassified Sphingomonas]|uniref:hypothetical protein n=1 Tax=unclassified Sphingomonas TaxID=196159 RepID=UPI001F59B21D|nr:MULTISPECIES: hypothetical protein [unclassified Sphingomonas]
MKIATRVAAAMLGLGLMTGAAQAQSVDQRHYDQQHRIDRGIRNGTLTPREAARVEHQQRSIDRQEAHMRYRDGGRLTRYDRARIQQRENRASRHIYRAKHNDRGY